MKIQKYKAVALVGEQTDIDSVEKGDIVEGHCYWSNNEECYMIVTRLQAECGGVGSGLVDVHIQVDKDTLTELSGEGE